MRKFIHLTIIFCLTAGLAFGAWFLYLDRALGRMDFRGPPPPDEGPTHAESYCEPGLTIPLWPAGAPDALGTEPEDTPAVEAFYPAAGTANGASIIVCAGGAYGYLTPHEGAPVAHWLAKHGFTAFFLRHRLSPKYRYPAQFNDVQRAIRFVRASALDSDLDPQRIGVIGFSAGGHLASLASVHYSDGDATSADPIQRVSSRPDFQILVYPVISMDPRGSRWTRKALLGDNPPEDLCLRLSSERHVTPLTPPAFLVHSTRDRNAPVGGTDAYAAALKAAGVPHEYVRGDIGAHGFGVRDFWSKPCMEWMRSRGIIHN